MSELSEAFDNIKRVTKKLEETDEDYHGACDECLTGWHERCWKHECLCSKNDHKGVLL